MQASLPSGWTEHPDASTGKTFYHNASTGVTSWDRPQAAAALPQAASALPVGWTEHVDPGSGKTFFSNAATGETSWERPQAPAAATPQAAAAAAPLPAGWTEHVDPGSGKTFFSQTATGVTSWERPQGDAVAAAAQSQPQASNPLEGWSEHLDAASGRSFFSNALTGETTWERPQAAQQSQSAQPAAQVAPDEPLRSIAAFLDEAKTVKAEISIHEEQALMAMLAQHATTLKMNAAQTFAAISKAASELLPKVQEKAALPASTLGDLNSAIQAFELRYGCAKSECMSTQMMMAKPGGRNYPTLVQQVETLCGRTLPELEEREAAAFKEQLLKGGVDPGFDAQVAGAQAKSMFAMQSLWQKYAQILCQSDHQPVYKKVGTSPEELSVMCWNVMEFPQGRRKAGVSPVLEGLLPFCDLVVKKLQREDDRQLLVDALSSEPVIAAHSGQVMQVISDALDTRSMDVVLLQEIGRDLQDKIKDVCRGKSWYASFSSGDDDSDRCDAITAIISKNEFGEEEGGGVEVQEAKTTRYFAAARRGNAWLVSCHVPQLSQATETAKQDVGVKTVQKLVQELHRKGLRLIVGGDWNADVKAVKTKSSAHMPYGCTGVNCYTDEKTCFGVDFPVDGMLEIL